MSERYFEDFRVGDRFRSADYTVAEAEMVDYARRYDPQPFHTEPAAAAQSFFGGLVASGWYTAAITMRLMAQSEIHVAGGLIHLLLVIAVIVLIFQLVTGRRAI